MLMACIALLSAGGAWMTWRRNPLYETRSAFKSLVIVLLSIAGVVAVIMGAVNFSMGKSPVVFGVTMAAVILFGAFSLIFVIQTVTVPKEAKLETALPPSAILVHVHRQKVYKWIKFLSILIVSLGILGFLLPGKFSFAAFGIAVFTFFIALIMMPIYYVTSRNFDRSLTALQLNPWVHWRYSEEQWKQWIEIRVQRAQSSPPPKFIFKRDWRKLVMPFGIIAGGVLIFGPGALLYRTLYVAGVCGLILGLVLLASRDSRHIPERLRKTLQKSPKQAYFGHDGVFCDGVFTTWLSMNVYLMSAAIDQREPRSLLFVFEKVVPNPYTGNQLIPIEQRVLIPHGAEDDVVRLRRELAARCSKARISLTAY
jgi:hypothetical protein